MTYFCLVDHLNLTSCATAIEVKRVWSHTIYFVVRMSQSRLASCIPLPLEPKSLVSVIEKAKDWALMHGVGMRDRKHFTKDAIQVGI